MNTDKRAKYFFFSALFIAFGSAIVLFHKFLPVLILGASVAVVISPVYQFFNRKLPWQTGWLSALITSLLFVIVICGPLFLIGSAVFKEAVGLYNSAQLDKSSDAYISDLNDSINAYLPQGLVFDVKDKLADLAGLVTDNISGVFTTTLHTIFFFILLVLSIFYFLKDGERWKRILVMLSPLADKDDNKVLHRLEHAVNGVIKGYLLIGLIQGTLMGVGFLIFGVPNAALFGLLAGVASLVPTIGTALVAIPAIVFLFFMSGIGAAIGFGIWATAIVGTIDNLLNPIFLGRRVGIPPLFILFSVLGGISLLGPVGVLIGPLSISLLHALLSIYREEKDLPVKKPTRRKESE